jgi:hypothetical protein
MHSSFSVTPTIPRLSLQDLQFSVRFCFTRPMPFLPLSRSTSFTTHNLTETVTLLNGNAEVPFRKLTGTQTNVAQIFRGFPYAPHKNPLVIT